MNGTPIEQFRDAIWAAGLTPPEVIEADGTMRRFASNGKRGDDAGWYLLHGGGRCVIEGRETFLGHVWGHGWVSWNHVSLNHAGRSG